MTKGGREGLTILGLDFRPAEYHVDVMFTVPAECRAQVEGSQTWPIGGGDCAGPAFLVGTIAGSGRTALGDTIVSVRIDVAEACYSAVEPGMDWPPPVPACTGSD